MGFRDLEDVSAAAHHGRCGRGSKRDVSGLDDDRKDALREQVRATLPVAADGSLHVTDRAWAVRGAQGNGL